MNLTRSSGVAERYPSWSPDGKTAGVLERPHRRVRADLRPADGTGSRAHADEARPGLPLPGRTGRPTVEALAFVDEQARIYVIGAEGGVPAEIDRAAPGWATMRSSRSVFAWSADSRWLAWSRPDPPAARRSSSTTRRHRSDPGHERVLQRPAAGVRSGGQVPLLPVRTGIRRRRTGDFDNSWTYANSTQIVAVPAPRGRAFAAGGAQRRRAAEGRRRGQAGDRRTRRSRTPRLRRATSRPARTARRGEERRRQEGRAAEAGRHHARRVRGARHHPAARRPGTTPTCSR